jgi:glycosyltransferase involved in cell wall biosynthesis
MPRAAERLAPAVIRLPVDAPDAPKAAGELTPERRCWPQRLGMVVRVDVDALPLGIFEQRLVGGANTRRHLARSFAVVSGVGALRGLRISDCEEGSQRIINDNVRHRLDGTLVVRFAFDYGLYGPNWVRTIYHGLPQQLLTPVAARPQYFAFLGRIAPEKSVDRAISIARRCGVPLRIAAKVDKVDREYFNEKINPLLDGSRAEYIGEIADKDKSEFLSGAVALLNPIDWPEPFGLVMIEAMACGTPVIAFNRGSVREVVDDGLTGFIVEDEEGAIGACDRLSRLSREKIRQRFEQRFTARRMALEYLAAYRSLMDRSGHRLKLIVDGVPALR